MTHVPATFTPITDGWSVKALNPQVAPVELQDRLAAGIPATVPGEATLDLVGAGLIPDPFDGDQESHQQWIGDVDWQFSCDFEWHANGQARHDLVAYGLDTVAALSINGRLIGNAKNYYRSYRWGVRPMLHDGRNTLTVTFASSVRESDRREQEIGYYPHTEHHAFNQLRKPSYQFGWDWGIDAANAGIWRPIGIDSWSGARIASVRPLVDVLPDGTGVLAATVEIERAGEGRVMAGPDAHACAQPVPVRVSVSGKGVSNANGAGGSGSSIVIDGEVAQGRNSTVLTAKIPQAKLWWPRGYGEQPLYDVDVSLGDEADHDPVAAWHGAVGFRTVRVDTRADDIGRPFQIYVNDVAVHAHGYNWVPADALLSRAGKECYSRILADLVESNANMVRVWGGGIYESDEFYELADRLGVMVWQDFTLACGAYPEDAETKAEIEAEAREHIARLSSHPSLVVWNGSNENYVAYSEWAGFKQALRDDDRPANVYGYGEKPWGDYYYSELFPRLLAELDPTRVYLPSSPMSFTKFVDANKDVDGTMHIWDVWNRVDYRKFADYTPRFADEFGYQAPPAWSTLTSVVHDEPIEPFGKQMLMHQKAAGGNYKLARGMRSHLTPGRIDDVSYNPDGTRSWLIPTDSWPNTEDWHWACQLQQAQAVRFGVEHMRSLEPVNAGVLIWQLNDDWPVVSWAAVDYDGRRKPLWYASRDFFAPRFATIQPRISEKAWHDLSWEGMRPACDRLALVIANDTNESWHGNWSVERRTLANEVLASCEFHVDLPGPGHVTLALPEDVAALQCPTDEIIVATPHDSAFPRAIYNGAEVVEQRLDGDPLDASVARTPDGYDIEITAKAYARDVFCMVDKVDPNATIDGGMATLLPGESVTWHVASESDAEPARFTDSMVLRTANDLRTRH